MLLKLSARAYSVAKHFFAQQIYKSRHTVVCRAAKDTGASHCEYINRKNQNAIFTQFALVIHEIWVIKLSFFFFFRGLGGLRLLFSHTCKNCCNFSMRSLIALKFGTNKEHIKENSGTEFGMNLRSIQCVRSDGSH